MGLHVDRSNVKTLQMWSVWRCGSVYILKKFVCQTDPINQLHRGHQTVIIRLRTHHAPLNVYIKKEHQANCVYCPNSDETVGHFIFQCPLYDNIRTTLLPVQPNIHRARYMEPLHYVSEQPPRAYIMTVMNRRDKIVEVWGTKKCKDKINLEETKKYTQY